MSSKAEEIWKASKSPCNHLSTQFCDNCWIPGIEWKGTKMQQQCSRCKKLADVTDLANYGGYLWHRICLVRQIYQHVTNQEKRDEILAPYEITSDELAVAGDQRAAYAL